MISFFLIIFTPLDDDTLGIRIGTTLQNRPLIFQLKLVYSFVIKVADSESDLDSHSTAIVSKIFAFYNLLH